MGQMVQIAIYTHAFLGGVGLISGIGSIILKKGSMPHKNMGKLFSLGMLGSSLLSIPIALMPKHENAFLMLIGVFTLYLILSGNNAIRFKTKEKASIGDYILSGIMLCCSLVMLVYGVFGIIQEVLMSVLYLFFGGFGALLALKDFNFYKKFKTQKKCLVSGAY